MDVTPMVNETFLVNEPLGNDPARIYFRESPGVAEVSRELCPEGLAVSPDGRYIACESCAVPEPHWWQCTKLRLVVLAPAAAMFGAPSPIQSLPGGCHFTTRELEQLRLAIGRAPVTF
jgi:hypothetical protein